MSPVYNRDQATVRVRRNARQPDPAVEAFRDAILDKLTYAVGREAGSARDHDWFAALMGAMGGAWLGAKRHRLTRWKLDRDGFALQRGNWWRIESRVPISRVQHLDLKRGPLERMLRLATLVIHTAGTRMAAVSVAGLDGEDAERLRDCLARQLDQDDDAL